MTTTTMPTGRADWFYIEPRTATFVFLVVGITVFRIVLLGFSGAELYFDEAQYWSWSKEPAFGYFTKPPLLAWTIGLSTAACGDTPFCARLPSPILHAASAILVYLIASKLFDRRVGFWASILLFTMPGTAVSATLISTDVPLGFFWCCALLATVYHVERPTTASGLLLGMAIGLGLNAKYAMIYFPMCLVLYYSFQAGKRSNLWHPATLLALAVAALLIAPNIVWNFQTDFATFSHTKDNANWGSGNFPNFLGALEFVGIQAAIVGPIPFAALMLALFGKSETPKTAQLRFVLYFSIPVFVLVTVQAFLSEANGNWAAPAFPAAAVAAAVVILQREWQRGLLWALVLAVGATIAVPVSTLLKDQFKSGPIAGEFSKVSGAGEFAGNVQRIARKAQIDTIVVFGRGLTASMIYELRDSGLDIRTYIPYPGRPHDHFQLTRPWHPSDPGVVLFVTARAIPAMPSREVTELETFDTRMYLAKSGGWKGKVVRVD